MIESFDSYIYSQKNVKHALPSLTRIYALDLYHDAVVDDAVFEGVDWNRDVYRLFDDEDITDIQNSSGDILSQLIKQNIQKYVKYAADLKLHIQTFDYDMILGEYQDTVQTKEFISEICAKYYLDISEIERLKNG